MRLPPAYSFWRSAICAVRRSRAAPTRMSSWTSPHTQADDVEVGGIRGREALDRLRNVVGRIESSWRPATAEEGFGIVRRRLFEPLGGADAFKQRDVTARAFADLYHAQAAEWRRDSPADRSTLLGTASPPLNQLRGEGRSNRPVVVVGHVDRDDHVRRLHECANAIVIAPL